MTDTTAGVRALGLNETVSLGSGASFWRTKAVDGVRAVTMTDGPHGVRWQAGNEDHLGINASEPATCFPPAVGLGQSWNPALIERVAGALGDEAQAAGVGVLLGPGINIKRDPRCGRNFEYYSEDPYLTGVLGTAWVRGIQARGVGASLKHFAANNQEHERMSSSSDIDERTFREIYLRAFERVVKDAQPWTVMCSYNRINGVHASQNRWLLTDVLRDEWGFTGAVVSDWGAVVDRVASLSAGLDLEMPGPSPKSDEAVTAAVEQGRLDRSDLDRSAARMIQLSERVSSGRRDGVTVDLDAHHLLAREAAAASIVLLKNDGNMLPLQAASSYAVIGDFAQNPRYQGGGSSHVNPARLDTPLEEFRSLAGAAEVTFAQGFTIDDTVAPAYFREEAVTVARNADAAVVFLGLSAQQESEGFDREHIELPSEQLELLKDILAVQPRTVVVLAHGGVLQLSTGVTEAPAVVDGALLGQAAGGAIADVLFGRVNPSGRLAETVPLRIEDVPSYPYFPGRQGKVRYAEGLFVGYRWYDTRKMAVSFPFGHGLSYTTFEYSDLVVEEDRGNLSVRVRITNTGDRAGREVSQVYLSLPHSAVERAALELKGFGDTTLEPGGSDVVTVSISRDSLTYWDGRVEDWLLESGDYGVHVGASSRDIRLSASVPVVGDEHRVPLTPDSTFAAVMAHPIAGPTLSALLSKAPSIGAGSGDALGMNMERMLASIPIGRMAGFGGGMSPADVEALLAAANKPLS
ncbi:glycoside hydrolase family 3 C-terminal domain-containing protein [Arthrobacter sp. TMT4-20]